MPDKRPIWCVVRVVDYQIGFLEFPDTYAPLSTSTWVTRDREEAYQTARAQRGLLLRCDGIPDEVSVATFRRALEGIADHCADVASAA
jgi:hypothetical protein